VCPEPPPRKKHRTSPAATLHADPACQLQDRRQFGRNPGATALTGGHLRGQSGISQGDIFFDPAPTRQVRAIRKYCHIVPGVFTPVLAKHTKNLSLVDILAVGVDRMQRNFDPMRKQVEAWKGTRLLDESAKLVIYQAPLWRVSWMFPSTWPAASTTCISTPRSRNSPRGRLGVSPTRSRARSRNSIPSRSSRQRPSSLPSSRWRPAPRTDTWSLASIGRKKGQEVADPATSCPISITCQGRSSIRLRDSLLRIVESLSSDRFSVEGREHYKPRK